MDSTDNYLDQVIKLLIKGTELKTLDESSSKIGQVLRRVICITNEHDLPKP